MFTAYRLKPLIIKNHRKVREAIEESLLNQYNKDETSPDALYFKVLLPCKWKMVYSLRHQCFLLSSEAFQEANIMPESSDEEISSGDDFRCKLAFPLETIIKKEGIKYSEDIGSFVFLFAANKAIEAAP